MKQIQIVKPIKYVLIAIIVKIVQKQEVYITLKKSPNGIPEGKRN